MSAFTSQASGSWGSLTTWTPTGVPGPGSTAFIQSPNVVTVTANTGVGDLTFTIGLTIAPGATLVIADGITLTVFGSVDNGGTITMGAGSALVETSSGADPPPPPPPPGTCIIDPIPVFILALAALNEPSELTGS